MKLIDVTRPMSPGIAVWPGDMPFTPFWSARIEKGSSVNVGGVTLSTHTGTHADAPLHFLSDGKPIDEFPLGRFFGQAEVVEIEQDAEAISTVHVVHLDSEKVERVLFKTRSSQVPADKWEPDFVHIEPAVIEFLGARGVVLIGTDAPSVDPAESKSLPAHHCLARHGIVNLENLYLRDVMPGRYDLIAFPVKLVGLDAAPVRAVLLER